MMKNKLWIFAVIVIAIVGIILLCSCSDNQKVPETTAGTAPVAASQKVYNFPKASEENDLMKIATGVSDKEAKVCYLTFDDGPTEEVTPKVLDELKKYDVKATFFTLGKMLEENKDIAKRAVEEGHLLANHSYSHVYENLYDTPEGFMEEIEKTQRLIEEISGSDTLKLMRFPGGSYDTGKYGAAKQEYKELLREKGYYFVDWNCLNGDAEMSLRSADQLLQRVKETAVGRNIVVLMHDAAVKTTTPDAIGSIVEYLKGKGYEFKRLDEIEYYEIEEEAEKEIDLIL